MAPPFSSVHHSDLGQIDGAWEDLQDLIGKSPQVLSQVVSIVRKAGDQLPTIVQIVDKTGKYLPTVLKVIERAGPYLPQVITIIDKAAPQLPTVIRIIEKATPYLPMIVAVVEDPALPEIMARIQTIQALYAAKVQKKLAKKSGLGEDAAPTGFDLKRALPVLDTYIYVQKHPWVPWVAGGSAVLLLGGIGFGLGRLSTRRSRSAVPA